MILLIAAEKGGAGKSTLATNLAVHFAHQNVDVVLVDTDSQATATKFVGRRDENGVRPSVPCVQRTGNVEATLRELDKRYALVVVDSGGRDSREMRTAMLAADLMLVPSKATMPDLETFEKMNDMIGDAKGPNPGLKAFAVLSQASTQRNKRLILDAKESLGAFENLSVTREVIYQRASYEDAILAGRGVVELADGRAKAEIQLLAQEFFNY